MGNGSLLKKEEDHDIEEDEISHSISLLKIRIQFRIQFHCGKFAFNFTFNFIVENSHSISLRKIHINDSILKTEERRRRFQDIHCGKFKVQISVTKTWRNFVTQFDGISRYTIWRNFALHNLTEFRVTQFDGISRYTIWRNFASHNLTIFSRAFCGKSFSGPFIERSTFCPDFHNSEEEVNSVSFRLFHEIYHSEEDFCFPIFKWTLSGKISSHYWTFYGFYGYASIISFNYLMNLEPHL